jgi:hypothetical protein
MKLGRGRVAALAALLAGALGAYLVVRGRGGHEWLQFPAGTTATYELRWQVTQDFVLGDRPLRGEVDLAGRLLLVGHGLEDDRWRVEARLADLDRHEFHAMGVDLVPDRDTARTHLETPSAIAEVGRDGAILAVRFAEETPPAFVDVMTTLLASVEVRTAPGTGTRTWSTESPAAFGIADTAHTSPARGAINRRRVAYKTLRIAPPGLGTVTAEGEGAIALAEGRVASLREREEVRATGLHATSSIELSLVQVAATGARVLPRTSVVRRPAEVVARDADDREHLRQRIAGLTTPELLAGVTGYGSGVAIADLNRWIWRASGLLALDPAACVALGEALASARLPTASVALGLDLLASAGTPAAQSAMRRALASPAVRGTQAEPQLLQRLAMVEKPTAQSIALVADRLAVSGPPGRDPRAAASALTLGAFVSRLDGAEAARWNQVLVDELVDPAAAPEDQARVLVALGNAARPANVDTVVRFAGDVTPAVRGATATALRRTDTPEARATLHRLAADPDGGVQRRALAALGEHALGVEDRRLLAAVITDGRWQIAADVLFVERLEAHAAESAEVAAALAVLAADHRCDPELRARIRRALETAR